MLVTSIFSFSHVFDPSQNSFNFSVIFILSSENAFDMDQSNFFSFGKELKAIKERLKRINLFSIYHIIEFKNKFITWLFFYQPFNLIIHEFLEEYAQKTSSRNKTPQFFFSEKNLL